MDPYGYGSVTGDSTLSSAVDTAGIQSATFTTSVTDCWGHETEEFYPIFSRTRP